MTRLIKLTCAALVLLTPMAASAQYVQVQDLELRPLIRVQEPPRLIEIEVPSPAPGLRAASAAGTTAGDNSDFCGNGEMFYWYEEDANGNEIDGTRQYGCDYD